MRTIYAIIPLLLLLTACSYTNGNGSVVTRNIEVEPFSKIALSWQGDIYLTQADNTKVSIQAESNIIDALTIESREGTLVIEKTNPRAVIKPTTDVKIYVTTPDITHVSIAGSGDLYGQTPIVADTIGFDIAGSGDIKLNDVQADDIRTAVAGSGDIYLTDIDVGYLYTAIAGSGDCFFTGNADKHVYEVSGSGDLMAQQLETKETSINIAGSGNVKVNAEDRLDINIAGSGDIHYVGNPIIDQKISGNGDILQIR